MENRQLNAIGVNDDPTFADLVGEVVKDEKFIAACGPLDSEARAKIAETALFAAFVYIGLVTMVQDIEHEKAGHG